METAKARGRGRGRGSTSLQQPTSTNPSLSEVKPNASSTSSNGEKKHVSNMVETAKKIALARGRGRGSGSSSAKAVQDLDIEKARSTTTEAMSGDKKQNQNANLPNMKDKAKYGESGTKVSLTSNYFKVLSKPDWCLYRHHVYFYPEEDQTRLRIGLIRALSPQIGIHLFDGTSLYTSEPLCRAGKPMELLTTDSKNGNEYRIEIKFIKQLEKGDYAYIQVFNIIVRNCFRLLNLRLVGRNYYDEAAKIVLGEHKLELWPGYLTSIRQHERDILMCAELSTKVMRLETVLDELISIKRNSRCEDDYKKKAQDQLAGCIIYTEYSNKTYRIDGIDFKTKVCSTFSKKDGSAVTYLDYYNTRYGITIRNVEQPMLESRSNEKGKRAGKPDIIMLVPELCRMTGYSDAMRTNYPLMKDVSDVTRVDPMNRVRRLLEFNRRLQNEPQCVEVFGKWNLKLDTQLVNVGARILPLEKVYFANKSTMEARNGDWSNAFRNNANHMMASFDIEHLIVITPLRYLKVTEDFVRNLIRSAQGMMFKIAPPKIFTLQNTSPGGYAEELNKAINQNKTNFTLCVLERISKLHYAAIKKTCYIDKGIPNQVVVHRNMTSKQSTSITTKIAIQMNCKVGGAPWSVPIPINGLMVIGFDTHHDTNDKTQSYGAMVASLDQECSRYYSCVNAHKSGQEFSSFFGINVRNALMKYREVHKDFPDKIVVYRDGVGEGNLSKIVSTEVKAIMDQAKVTYSGVKQLPKLTFIVVSKEINTRFFNGVSNPTPGTVVDDVVTDPSRYDFFLVPQCVRQGTVTPTHFNVIHDTMNLSPDHIQRLTYKLTHLYYNWSGAVRVPAPCQYAHKLAFLTGQSLNRTHLHMNNVLYFL